MLDKDIKVLEENGHNSAAFLLRNWQSVINAKLISDIDAEEKILSFGSTKEIAKRVSKMSVDELAERARGIASFHYPEIKGLLTDGGH